MVPRFRPRLGSDPRYEPDTSRAGPPEAMVLSTGPMASQAHRVPKVPVGPHPLHPAPSRTFRWPPIGGAQPSNWPPRSPRLVVWPENLSV